MDGKDLLKGLNFVDDSLIEEAEKRKFKKLTVRFIIPIAASFAIVLTIFSLWLNNQSNLSILPNDNIPPMANDKTPNDSKNYTLYFNKIDNQTAANLYIKGHFWKNLSSEQVDKILPNLNEKYNIDSIVNYSHTDGKTTIFSINTKVKVEGKADINITIAPNEVVKCYIIDGKPTLSEIEGIDIEAGIFKTDENSKGERTYIYYANFKIDDVAYYVEFAGDENDETFFTNILADIILGGKADLSVFDNPTIPELRDDTLTENEAYTETDFGKYLPKVPNTYQFNDALRFVNQDSNYLLASWSQGYNDIRIKISNLKEEDKERIISIDDTKLYDMSLYTIPWSDSMPIDKSHIIENPIFKIEDLTLDSVKMRGYSTNEQGDTNTLKMRFSVLYDNILVEIITEGVSTEYLFNELSKIPII